MEKKLPGVFVNKINTRGNNKKVYYEYKEKEDNFSTNQNKLNIPINIRSKIIDVFRSSHYIYKVDVEIKLKDKVITRRVIGYNESYLITFDNEKILIDDILDIKLKEE